MRWFDRLLLLCAAIVVLVNLLPLGAQLFWMLELTTHFRVQYLVATVLLLALAALRRRWLACLALLCVGAVSAVPVVPYLPVPLQTAAAGAGTPLKVLTVNVSYRRFSPRRLLAIIGDADPDVVVVQELTPYAEGVLADLDQRFPHRFAMPAEGPYGIALWSRFEFASVGPFALGRLPAIEARVRAPNGVLTLFGVHLSAPTNPRRAAARGVQLKELAVRSAAVTGPLIVAGDFNVSPYSPLFAEWLAASGLTDTRRGRTLSVSWPTTLPILGIPIDHIAVSEEFTVVRHRRLPNFDSDHFGVLAEVTFAADTSGVESP